MVCIVLGIYRICTTMVLEENSDSFQTSRWRHQIERFSALLALCAENSPVTGEFPAQKPVTRSFDAFLSSPD